MSSIDKFFTFLAFIVFGLFVAIVTLQVLEMMYYNGTGPYEEKASVWNPPRWL